MAKLVNAKLGSGKRPRLSFAPSVELASPILIAMLLITSIYAQLLHPSGTTAPSFEVATIKPSRSSGTTSYGVAEGRFRADNATVAELIKLAYDVRSDDQVEKGPAWTKSERFDINAKITETDAIALQKLAPTQRFDQYRLMMQALLAERFKLKVSTREEELPVYAMVVARNGSKLTATAPGSQHMPWLWGGSKGDLTAKNVSMNYLAGWLSGRPDVGARIVIDKTGLSGIYDFTLKWTPIDSSVSVPAASVAGSLGTGGDPVATRPSLITAMQEQLGLRLAPTHEQVEVLVIEDIEQPSPN